MKNGPPSESERQPDIIYLFNLVEEPVVGASGSIVRLYLCRHGETDYNAQGLIQGSGIDRPLSALGVTQAKAMADSLARVHLDLIVSSTLTRSVQTAEAVRHYQAYANIVSHRGVCEMSFGDLEGKKVSANTEVYTEVQAAWANGDYEKRWPGSTGENPAELVRRARAALRDLGIIGLGAHHGVRHVAIIAHGRFNKILLASLLSDYGVKRCGDLVQDNCCINVIDIDPTLDLNEHTDDIDYKGDGVTVFTLNYRGHLLDFPDPTQPKKKSKKM